VTAPLRLGVTGAQGRMGQAVVRAAQQTPGVVVAAATEREGSPVLGQDVGTLCGLGALGVPVEDSLARALRRGVDVVVDFTSPQATASHAGLCAQAGVALVTGTTGLQAVHVQALEAAARLVPVVAAPNMSVGVNVMLEVAGLLARRLGPGFDAEVLEIHHRHKKDAPSGTAVRLAELLVEALGRSPDDVRTTRSGEVGARPEREIGVQALRGGDVVGEHTVYFLGAGERLELTHRATSREQFAFGALRAARFCQGRAPGLYGMKHVLGGEGG
jgi:4-hydroxy-tetrahydrodipicolinate reductase